MREKLMRRYEEETAYRRYDARTAEEAQLAEEEARRAAQIEAEAAREAADQAQPEEETAPKENTLRDSRGNEIPANALGVTPGGQYANTAAKLYTLLRAEKEHRRRKHRKGERIRDRTAHNARGLLFSSLSECRRDKPRDRQADSRGRKGDGKRKDGHHERVKPRPLSTYRTRNESPEKQSHRLHRQPDKSQDRTVVKEFISR
jgi:hypothetical protein